MRVWFCLAICCMEQRVKVVPRVAAPYLELVPMVQDLQTYIVLLEVHLNALIIIMLIQQTATERIHVQVWPCRAICCMEQRARVAQTLLGQFSESIQMAADLRCLATLALCILFLTLILIMQMEWSHMLA